MPVLNWLWNLLDLNRRREAVRVLASVRSRVAEAQMGLRQIQQKYMALQDRLEMFEREGASSLDLIEWCRIHWLLSQQMQEYANQLTKPLEQVKCDCHTTPENVAFERRLSACLEKLMRRIDTWEAESIPKYTEIGIGLEALLWRLGKLKAWDEMTQGEFGNFITQKLYTQGFSAQQTKLNGLDRLATVAVWQGGGRGDCCLVSNPVYGRTYLIQYERCKPEQPVGEVTLWRFYDAMKSIGASDEGIFVTNSQFTDPAIEYARRRGIRLIDGAALGKILSYSDRLK